MPGLYRAAVLRFKSSTGRQRANVQVKNLCSCVLRNEAAWRLPLGGPSFLGQKERWRNQRGQADQYECEKEGYATMGCNS